MSRYYSETNNGIGLHHDLNLKDDCVYVRADGQPKGEFFLKYDSSCNVIYKGKTIARVGFAYDIPHDRFRPTSFKMTLTDSDVPCVKADIGWGMRDFTEFEPQCTKYLVDNGIIQLP